MSTQLQLHADEAAALAQHEAVIERGITTFYEVGTALLHIRDERLYRETHDTFEAYCRERWNMTRQYANKVIAATTVMGNLETRVSIPSPVAVPLPVSERQVRPLASLSPEDQRTVWAQAVEESNGEQPAPMKVAELSKLVKNRIVERRREADAEAGRVDPAEHKTSDGILPPIPMSREEFREYREECRINDKRNSQVWDVIEAVEKLSKPALSLEEIAAEMRRFDGPDVDWVGQSEEALRNLQIIVSELHK